ncbi:hypothetical protein D3C87_2134780 [compost metagenome]
MTAQLTEFDIVFFVVLIFDFTDDQFENIFDSHKAGNTAKFIDNNRHVVALGAELFQHAIDTLTFRNHHRLA